MYKYLLRKIM